MTTKRLKIKKCLKVELPNNSFVIPFSGNFTERKKERFASQIKSYISENKIDFEEFTPILCDIFGTVAFDLFINKDINAEYWVNEESDSEKIILIE